MGYQIQYDLFETVNELTDFRKEFLELKKSHENVRRGLFARHNDLAKKYLEQQQEIETLKSKIVKL